MSLFETIDNLQRDADKVRERAYGAIEVTAGKLVRIQFRPYPKLISGMEARWDAATRFKRRQRDTCRLYYNQPLFHRNYLALSYIESSIDTTWHTLFSTLQLLDRIAYLKQSDAILAELSSDRISDRLMRRWGWERHLPGSRKRHFIKRFYGEYPAEVTRELAIVRG